MIGHGDVIQGSGKEAHAAVGRGGPHGCDRGLSGLQTDTVGDIIVQITQEGLESVRK